jgi:hypothetical protein
MLSQAIAEINREADRAIARRGFLMRRKRTLQTADAFLLSLEELIEEGECQVPSPLMDDIVRFVRPLSRRLSRHLVQRAAPDPVRVLDVLFDTQRLLLSGPAAVPVEVLH